MVDNAEFRHRIPEEDGGHTCIPNAVLLDARIAPMTRLCYSVIKSYAFGDKRDARPGQKTLAEQLGVKDRMVRNYLTELEVLGLISIEQRGQGLTNIYWIEPLAGLEERILHYVEWLAQKKVKPNRQCIATPERQPITGLERQPVASPGGNTLPTNKTSMNKTRGKKKTPPPKRPRDKLFDLVLLRSFASNPKDKSSGKLYGGRVGPIVSALKAQFKIGPEQEAAFRRELRRAYRWHARQKDERGQYLRPCQSAVAVVEMVKRYRRAVPIQATVKEGEPHWYEKEIEPGMWKMVYERTA